VDGQPLEPYPTKNLADYARTGAEAAVAAIPIVGGPLEVLVDAVLTPSLDRRRERWMHKLAELVERLSERVEGFDVASLAGDEAFVSAVIDASRIAVTTHLDDKLEMLRNCLEHMALEDPRDDFLDAQFLRFVDEMEPEHFVVLQYLTNPRAWFDTKGISAPDLYQGSPMFIMGAARLPVGGGVLEIVLRNLSDRGLANTQSLQTMMTAQGAWQPLATSLGERLLDFVSSSSLTDSGLP
jgi:hypothetical protein